MAKLLTTAGMGFEIEQIIIDASDQLVLVSPYLQLGTQIAERLTDANERKVQMTLVYRESKISKRDKKILESLEHLEIYQLENLHAKCYYNENRLVLGSMNFYDYSQTHNREMGVLLTLDEDPEAFNAAVKEACSIKRAAELSKKKQFYTQIIDTHKKQTNFHLPALKKALESRYPEAEIKMTNRSISIKPSDSKVELIIDHGLVVDFYRESAVESFKKRTPDDLLAKESVNQVWSGSRLIINFVKSLNDYKITEDNQALIGRNFLSMITKLWIYL